MNALLLSLVLALADEGTAVEITLDGEFSLELEAHWAPLSDTVYHFDETKPIVRDLAVASERRTYDADAFRPLLPPGKVEVGDLWPVDPADVVRFLKQLHPGATEKLHHDMAPGVAKPGAWAVLRALGDGHAEILLRAHADFLLAGDGSMGSSSWATPAQFEGRVLVDRARGVVTAFSLALPDQSANVDVNLQTDQGLIVDIGRFARMELVGGDHGRPSFTREIDDETARSALRRKFYAVAEVDWLPLEEALATSRETGKPMHVIALFGSFLDESC